MHNNHPKTTITLLPHKCTDIYQRNTPKQLSRLHHQLALVDGKSNAIMHGGQHLLLVILNVHKVAIHASLTGPLSLNEVPAGIAVVVPSGHQTALSILHGVHALCDDGGAVLVHRLDQSDGAIVHIQHAKRRIDRLHVSLFHIAHDPLVETLEQHHTVPVLRRGNVVVLLALGVRKRGVPHDVGDSPGHDELRPVADELQRGGEVAQLQRGEAVVDDAGIVHLRLTRSPLAH